MNARLLLISSDETVAKVVRSAIDSTMSLMVLDRLPAGSLAEKYQPNAILIDSDVRNGVQTAFERIELVRSMFSTTAVIVLGNEMSAQLVLAALRAGADDFVDREANAEQINLAICGCLAKTVDTPHSSRAKIAGVLGALGSEQDQDFAVNLAVRAAKRSPGEMTLYVDLSLPMTQAGVALGLEPEFGVQDAIREIARVDSALLESALAREPRSGLYVMPLGTDFGSQSPVLEAGGFAALLQVLRSCCSTIVIYYGAFSRERQLLDMLQPAAHFFVCCNQRFTSIRGASELLRWFSQNGLSAPEVVVHTLVSGSTPSAADIRRVLKIGESINLDVSWDELAESLNSAKPLALQENSYSHELDACLARLGFASQPELDLLAQLRDWLLPKMMARAS